MPGLISTGEPVGTADEAADGTDFIGDTDFISGYGVPMDPMDLLQCDSCQ